MIFPNLMDFCFETISMAIPNWIDILCFEFNNVMLGTMKNLQEFSANVAFINVATLVFAFPLGIGGALNF